MKLFEHWEAKLASLVIAIGLWLYTGGQVTVEKTLTVTTREASIAGLPDGLEITSIAPAEFTVVVNVPADRANDYARDLKPRLVLPAGLKARAGEQGFPIVNRVLGLDPSVRILRVQPEGTREIIATYDLREEGDLGVDAPAVLGLPVGVVPEIRLSLTRVRISAGSQVRARLARDGERVRFAPVLLDAGTNLGASEREERVLLTPLPGDYRVLDQVEATIVLRPAPITRQFANLPVQILAPRDLSARFAVAIDPPVLTVAVTGPQAQLDAFKPDAGLALFVDLGRALEPGTAVELPVRYVAPAWAAVSPASVKVTVTPLR